MGQRSNNPKWRNVRRGMRRTDVNKLFGRLEAGDESARERLVELYLPLARRIAKRYVSRGEDFEDTAQVASLGLLKAINRFQVERGFAFTSYAVPTIDGEIKRHFRDHTWGVHVQRSLQDLVHKIDDTERAITAQHGRSPTVANIADALDCRQEDVLEAMEAKNARSAISMDSHIGDGSEVHSLHELIGDFDPGYEEMEDFASAQPCLAELEQRERLILALRFIAGMTQAQIAERIGISQMQVSRLLRSILQRLRVAIDRGALPG
jgi:RNA polymerase sigma-B factor